MRIDVFNNSNYPTEDSYLYSKEKEYDPQMECRFMYGCWEAHCKQMICRWMSPIISATMGLIPMPFLYSSPPCYSCDSTVYTAVAASGVALASFNLLCNCCCYLKPQLGCNSDRYKIINHISTCFSLTAITICLITISWANKWCDGACN